jgi:ribosome-binding factor A
MQRSDRVGDEIQKVVADLIQNEIKDPRLPPMASVVEVRFPATFRTRQSMSVCWERNSRKRTAAALQSAAGFIRREVAHRIRLRLSPELHLLLMNRLNGVSV